MTPTDAKPKFQEPAPPRSLTDAIARIDWICQPPHTIDQIIGIWSETSTAAPNLPWGASPAQLAAHLKTMEELASAGSGHADPTSQAKGPASADLAPIDEQIWQLCAAAKDLDDHASECAGQPLWSPPGRPVSRTEQLRDATTRVHHARSAGLDDDGHDCREDRCDAPFRDHLVLERTIIDNAGWLHLKALGIWHASKGETKPVAEQKAIAECRVCGPWRKGTIAVAAGRCAECDNFHRNHPDCERTEAIVKRAEYGKGPTPGQMAEARAAGKAKGKRTERAS